MMIIMKHMMMTIMIAVKQMMVTVMIMVNGEADAVDIAGSYDEGDDSVEDICPSMTVTSCVMYLSLSATIHRQKPALKLVRASLRSFGLSAHFLGVILARRHLAAITTIKSQYQ